MLQLMPDEKITAMIPIRVYDDDQYLFMATEQGLVKKTPIREYANVRKERSCSDHICAMMTS
jgi:DNA gyrase subunit A